MVTMLIYKHSAYEQTTTILRIIISKIKTFAIRSFVLFGIIQESNYVLH
jgi:hypothetical protein